MIATWHAVIAVFFMFRSNAENVFNEEENLSTQLPGAYDYINVQEFLGFSADSSLNIICPKHLEIMTASGGKTFDVELTNGTSGASGLECYIEGGETVNVSLERVEPEGTAIHSPQESGQATVTDLENHYQTFFGNFSDYPLVCNFFDTKITPINLTVRDVGYIHTILNYYKDAPRPLGSNFEEFDWKFFSKHKGSFLIGMTIIPDSIGCSFLKRDDSTSLMALKNETLNPTELDSDASTEPSLDPPPHPHTNDSGSACFPAKAMVMLESGEYVAIELLRIGDKVLDSTGSFSPVMLFTHSDSERVSQFVHIHAENSEVVLSPGHFLYANKRAVSAERIRSGDVLTSISKDLNIEYSDRVIMVERHFLRGLYNPQTASGKIVTFWEGGNGVLTTTYTKAVAPHLAHSLLWPLRVITSKTSITLNWLSGLFNDGFGSWPFLLQNALS